MMCEGVMEKGEVPLGAAAAGVATRTLESRFRPVVDLTISLRDFFVSSPNNRNDSVFS